MAKKKARKTSGTPSAKKPNVPAQDQSSPSVEGNKGRCPVVGIGASAGGVEAIKEFFGAIKDDSGMAFVVVTHLDPEHKSAFPEILAKVTPMPVAEVTDGVRALSNHVYVLPPNAEVVMRQGMLWLAPRSAVKRPPMPIDTFFTSMAEDLQNQAVGVVLSGMGSDGTGGLRAIKGAGGITFAQDQTAVYAAMPRSAVQSGCVDFVFPPAGIAMELLRVCQNGYLTNTSETAAPVSEGNEFSAIMRLLSHATGIEFNNYKVSTLQRRVQRRMMACKLSSLSDYLAYLRGNPLEVQSLFEDTLIQVTSFFRDPGAFQALAKSIFPPLLENRPPQTPIRIWVPGCSTGEEVYSLAICLLEFLGEHEADMPIKLFGTDVSDKALATARAGIYLENIIADVSASRLRHFFVKTDGNFQVKKKLRDLCVFARQDVARDPPFSQLDLVSCRNVLIYFGPTLQSRIPPTFHYALKPNGILFLGTSETVGSFADLFEVLDKKHKIYRRTSKLSRIHFEYMPSKETRVGVIVADKEEEGNRSGLEVQREADRLVLARYAPSGVVVDEDFQIVQFRGHTGVCLEPAPGAPTPDLLQMAREGLLGELRATLDRAKRQNLPVRSEKVRVRNNDHFKEFNLEVLPLTAPSSGKRHYVILFEEADRFGSLSTAPASPGTAVPGLAAAREEEAEKDQAIARLKQELAATRAYLQSVIEDKEAANEELKAANEEIISSNEELQSTNEELETAKEELQATNEELTTVNDELQNRIAVTSQLSDDLTNLIESVNVPTIVVGNDLRLRRLTPSAQRVLNLVPGDIGRPLGDFKLSQDVASIETLIHEVLDTFAVKQLEVKDQNGVWYKMSIYPYKRDLTKIDGAVITLADIDGLKRREKQIEEAAEFSSNILNTILHPLVILDAQFLVRYANSKFYETFRTTSEQTEKYSFYALEGRQWDIPRLRNLLDDLVARNEPFPEYEIRKTFPILGERVLLLTARQIVPQAGEAAPWVLLVIQDATDRKRLERQVLEAGEREQRLIGQELHDNVGQELTGLCLLADALAHRLQAHEGEEKTLGAKVRDGLQQMHRQIRSLAHGLIPLEMNAEGLRLALEDIGARTTQQGNVLCRFEGDLNVTVEDAARATHLYRIAQEAVSNALRHGKPHNIVISLHQTAGTITLAIQDDGTGISESGEEKKGVGMGIMQYRAGLIGGTLTIGSGKNKGTVVTCALPKDL